MHSKLTIKIAEGVHQIRLGLVNAYLLESDGSLVLIDTGFPNSTKKIFAAVTELGYTKESLSDVVVTHAHPDHIGSAAAIVRETGAKTWIHRDDVDAAEFARPPKVHPRPGLLPHLLFALMHILPGEVEAVKVDHVMQDGDLLPFGDLRAIHAPGHCAGQVALYSQTHSLLFAADSCMNLRGLRQPLVNEDIELGLQSLRRISELDFDKACFGHGSTISGSAGKEFKKAFAKWP
jgi:glyoxylase-like metal-dependent hydrolase (beta-lactamase superfamily II)